MEHSFGCSRVEVIYRCRGAWGKISRELFSCLDLVLQSGGGIYFVDLLWEIMYTVFLSRGDSKLSLFKHGEALDE